jgi:hypothetical protein
MFGHCFAGCERKPPIVGPRSCISVRRLATLRGRLTEKLANVRRKGKVRESVPPQRPAPRTSTCHHAPPSLTLSPGSTCR